MCNIDRIELDTYQEKAKSDARNNFREGLNCSECVFKSFLDLGFSNFPPETVALSSGFGGGIGMTKNNCGAFLGAALAVATIKGRKNPFSKETPDERVDELNNENGIYSIFGSLVNEFQEKYGTLQCQKLIEPFGDWHSRERKKNCQEIIGYAAALAVKYALDEK